MLIKHVKKANAAFENEDDDDVSYTKDNDNDDSSSSDSDTQSDDDDTSAAQPTNSKGTKRYGDNQTTSNKDKKTRKAVQEAVESDDGDTFASK
jgi:hypothetical protein